MEKSQELLTELEELVNKVKENLSLTRIETFFQPIFSLGAGKVIGFEALLRPFRNGTSLSPLEIFEQAKEKKIGAELDRASRYIAFKTFLKLIEYQNGARSLKNSLLFFNFDASILDEEETIAWYIHSLTQTTGLPPNSIVIEVIETRVKNFKILKKFVETYKELGFLIALDDVGVDYSNLSRISELKPDFIKIDRELISQVSKDIYKQHVVKSLSYLAKEIGAFVIGEGIENEKDFLKCAEFGIDFFQGYLFCEPLPLDKLKSPSYFNKIAFIKTFFEQKFFNHVLEKKRFYTFLKEFMDDLIREIKKIHPEEFKEFLNEIIKENQMVHSLYVVDESNTLLTPLFLNPSFTLEKSYQKLKHLIFEVKEKLPVYPHIYYLLTREYTEFISEPYLNVYTKKCVVTFSRVFKNNLDNHFYILCVDFFVPEKLLNLINF